MRGGGAHSAWHRPRNVKRERENQTCTARGCTSRPWYIADDACTTFIEKINNPWCRRFCYTHALSDWSGTHVDETIFFFHFWANCLASWCAPGIDESQEDGPPPLLRVLLSKSNPANDVSARTCYSRVCLATKSEGRNSSSSCAPLSKSNPSQNTCTYGLIYHDVTK